MTYIGNFNSHEIELWNVFAHSGVMLDLANYLERNPDDKEGFLKKLNDTLLYHYWCKCEWEVIIDHWPHFDDFQSRKVDVYEQVMNNWDVFAEYTWNNRTEIAKWKRQRDKTECERKKLQETAYGKK